ncbi:ATP-binding protein [Coleofasciculus sp. FACHB-SPT36]|uniref:sensor histidine kinase n=1 Tax=Cyanophyceae TaxID=3028117 RepID=UPI00168BA475|nr:ATP-binding protein [Coleofasciculus sp. FACHB-SPT36]MBD2537354.1 sensor histidine kinase [Coleofasciculus sp. FACHB-SPT36]
MFQATRRRLAIWYTAVTAVLLLLFATGVYLYVRNTLIERVDDTLNHVVEVVQRSLVIETAPNGSSSVNVEASFRNDAEAAEDDHIDLEWFSPTGELLWSTLSEPLDIPIHLNRTGETVPVVRASWQGILDSEFWSSAREATKDSKLLLRQVTQRVQMGRQVLGYLRVSHPWFEVAKPTRLLMVDLIFGTGLMLISVATSGWWLSGLAMEPVRESYQRLKQFTADASHELRNPIAMIQTNVQVALDDPDLVEASGEAPIHYRQQLKVVERLTRRLGRLVDDLLFLARQDSGMKQRTWVQVHLDALLMEVIEEQQLVAAEKGVKLSLDFGLPILNMGMIEEENLPSQIPNPKFEEDAFAIEGDWDQLARLFTNLVSNALQYTPAGGKVDVTLQWIDTMNRLATKRHGMPHLQVRVSDTGIGIPESALPHIFDRFYRVDPARTHIAGNTTVTGSGLGLAIAQAIVETHQGHIQIESILHQGTTVTVTLPAATEEY